MLFRKPKALVNSTAFNQMDAELKEIYNKHFQHKERDFVKLPEVVGTYGLATVYNAINSLEDLSVKDLPKDA